jgi:hypothetical protein
LSNIRGSRSPARRFPSGSTPSGEYRALGIVFDPMKRALTELKRLRTGHDLACITREDAENFGAADV